MSAVVDANVPRFNQAMVALLVGVAFVGQWWPVVAATAILLGLTRFSGARWGLFTRIYQRLVRPRLTSPITTEPVGPPRFAQLLGVLFLTAASVCFVMGWPVVGWVVALTVFALALLAATTRICVGCILYERAVSTW